jgi:hypothetical protein
MLRMGKRINPRVLWPDYHPLFWNREEAANTP